MKTLFYIALAVLSMSAAAQAEGRGYFFVGPGGSTIYGRTNSTYYVGGGGELLLPRGIGAGVEAQGVIPSGALSDSLGIASVNAYYHPYRNGRDRIDPFATVGYSLAFRNGTANLWNFGGGMNYWFHENIALLVEFRDHPWGRGPATQHLWGFRFGLSFR